MTRPRTLRLAASYLPIWNNPPLPLIKTRAPLSKWLAEADHDKKLKPSYRYYIKLYWATPPWLTREMFDEMKEIYHTCPEGSHVDHIVPLHSPGIVRGFHVPGNLQHMTAYDNMAKGARFWEDCPNDIDIFQGELF